MHKRTDKEGPIHKAVLGYLRRQFPDALIHHSPNEGVRGGNRGALDGARNKAMGQVAGFPDLLVIWRGHVWAFEVKAEGNSATQAQKNVAGIIEANGGKWAVVRSIEDARECVSEWKGTTEIEVRGQIS